MDNFTDEEREKKAEAFGRAIDKFAITNLPLIGPVGFCAVLTQFLIDVSSHFGIFFLVHENIEKAKKKDE